MKRITKTTCFCLIAALAFLLCVSCAFADSIPTLYGYRSADASEEPVTGFVSFDSTNPSEFTVLSDQSSSETVAAGEYVSGSVYGFTTDGDYFYADTADKYSRVTVVAGLLATNQSATDMAYDYESGTMYVLVFEEDKTKLEVLDLEQGTLIEVADCSGFQGTSLRALACNSKSQLYVLDTKGILYTLDKEGVCTQVGKTGMKAYYKQSMAFDRTNDTLYWARSAKKSASQIYSIDVETGEATAISSFETDYSLVALYTEYNYTPELISGIPNAVLFGVLGGIALIAIIVIVIVISRRRNAAVSSVKNSYKNSYLGGSRKGYSSTSRNRNLNRYSR